jgi:H+/gluconate symporter-like permease
MGIGIIGMLLAIAVMVIGAYRGIKPIPLTILAAIFVILLNKLGIWQTYTKVYAAGFGSVVTAYFFIFVSSAVYAMIMDKTNCTAAIGFQLIKWFGTKHVMLITFIFTVILTYGGVSLFVCVFAVLPIAFVLFREANLPRHLILGPLGAGSAGITMTTLPATPALTNISPSQYLGTPMTAAPVFSIILAIIMVVLTQCYFVYATKTAMNKKEVFSFPAGFDESTVNVDKSKLPPPPIAFIPIIVLILFIIISIVAKAPYAADSALLTTLAMIIASIICLVLNPKKITITGVKNWIGDGSFNAISAVVGLAAVVAFGGVVSSAPAFQAIVKWLLELDTNVYLKGVVGTAVISGITGSSSGGVRIMLQNLADYFINSGANLQVLHRLMAVAAGSLDTLPHSSGLFLFLAVLGCTHKEAYKHLFWTTVIVPAIVVVIGVVVAAIVW